MHISSFETYCHTKTWSSSKTFINFDNLLADLWDKCPKMFTRKYLKQFSIENYTWRLVIVQNVLIFCILLIYLDQTVPIHFVNDIYTLGILGNFNTENYT